MALTMREKKKIGLEYSRNYLKARKKEKGRKIMKLQKRLLNLIFLKEEIRKKDEKDEQDFKYIFDDATNKHFEYILNDATRIRKTQEFRRQGYSFLYR